MPPVEVTARTGAAADTDADTRVVGLFEGESLDDPSLQALVDSGEAKSGLRKLAAAHEDGRRVIVAGLGKRAEFDHDSKPLARRARSVA